MSKSTMPGASISRRQSTQSGLGNEADSESGDPLSAQQSATEEAAAASVSGPLDTGILNLDIAALQQLRAQPSTTSDIRNSCNDRIAELIFGQIREVEMKYADVKLPQRFVAMHNRQISDIVSCLDETRDASIIQALLDTCGKVGWYSETYLVIMSEKNPNAQYSDDSSTSYETPYARVPGYVSRRESHEDPAEPQISISDTDSQRVPTGNVPDNSSEDM